MEPIGGDPLRRQQRGSTDAPPDTSSALFRYLNASKRGATLTDHDSLDQLEELIADADVLVESNALQLDIPTLRQRHRHLVVASITPYGRAGPSHRGQRPSSSSRQRADRISIAATGTAHPCRPVAA